MEAEEQRDAEGTVPEASPPPQDPAPEAASDGADGAKGTDPERPDGAKGTDPEAPSEPGEPDYKDLYLRAAAESENVRKRARRDVESAQARGVARLARELLPALDNLDRAIAAAEAQEGDEEHHLTKGIRLVQQELLGAMARVGIEPYSPEGQAFDPHQHEAIAQQPTEGAESGTVVVVYQPGYQMTTTSGEVHVLRAAKVVVAA